MKVQIDRLMELFQAPDLPVTPVAPQRQERIVQLTRKKINARQATHPAFRRRAVRILASIAAALVLLCGSVYAAYEFQLFDFSQLFGENAGVIEDAVVTYDPEPSEVVSAFTGRGESSYASMEDYNFQLQGKVTVTDTLIFASFQVSTVREDVPKFTTTGMTIGIEGHESESFLLRTEAAECISVYADLDEPLPADACINFLITDGENSQILLRNAPMEWSHANTAVFTDHDPAADYVVDTVSMTKATITVTGHFQKAFADYAAALDASGGYILSGTEAFALYDTEIDRFDAGKQRDDLEGYLSIREVGENGSFTIQWTMIKGIPGFGTLVFDGRKYCVPAPDQTEEPVEYVPVPATSARTQDYRFTLESMVATPNVICAIVDMEPITQYGRENMNIGADQLTIVCSNLTHKESGSAGSVLIEAGDTMSRYLVYNFASGEAPYAVGDWINFQILSIVEHGDTAQRSYNLFDVELSRIISVSAEAKQASGDGEGPVHYDTVTITPLSLYLHGTYDPSDPVPENPEIMMTFRDGTSIPLMDSSWQPTPDLSTLGEYGIAAEAGGGNDDGSSGQIHRTYLFSQIIALEDVKSIHIDGVEYQVLYETA